MRAKTLLGTGRLSDRAFAKYLASTSNDGKSLTHDDGGVHAGNRGAIARGHIDAKQNTRARGAGRFAAPSDRDFGPADTASRSHIDSRGNRMAFPDSAVKRRNQGGFGDMPVRASDARVRRTSATEVFIGPGDEYWYGAGNRRQER
jgi:hypothetical protein